MKAQVLKMYAVRVRSTAEGPKEISRKEIGTARFGLQAQANVISANKYNQLKRALFKAYTGSKGGETIVMMDELGRKDCFGGYPCENNGVSFTTTGKWEESEI